MLQQPTLGADEVRHEIARRVVDERAHRAALRDAAVAQQHDVIAKVAGLADVLAYLLGTRERAASTQETADATAYSRATVGGALGDMARAGFIQETGDRTARYFAPVRPWAQLLGFDGRPDVVGGATEDRAPAWRYWSGLFAFLAQTDRWAREADDLSDYLRSSRARDLYIRYRPAFEKNRIDVPRPEVYQGAAYLEGFEETVDALIRWLPKHL